MINFLVKSQQPLLHATPVIDETSTPKHPQASETLKCFWNQRSRVPPSRLRPSPEPGRLLVVCGRTNKSWVQDFGLPLTQQSQVLGIESFSHVLAAAR